MKKSNDEFEEETEIEEEDETEEEAEDEESEEEEEESEIEDEEEEEEEEDETEEETEGEEETETEEETEGEEETETEEEEEGKEEEEIALDESQAHPVPKEQEKKVESPQDIPLNIIIEMGRVQMPIKTLMELKPGNLLDLHIHPEAGVDLVVNGFRIGKGELLQIGETIGIRILELG